jgi:hypothetical protein
MVYFTSSFFRRVRKTMKSDCYLRRVCPFIHIKYLDSYVTDFHEIRYLSIFRKFKFH